MCRTSAYRHSWDDFTPPQHQLRGFSVRPDLSLRCTRCGTEKFLWLDHEGNYSSNPRYRHPEGYKVHLAPGERLTAPELRAEIIRRRTAAQRGKSKRRLKSVS
jgi:hypothetical protein